MVLEADILIENYRPDVMPRLGIGYEALKEVNPRLIMLSISGFGHDGPESRRAAYAPVVHAESGLLYRMHERSGLPYHDLPLSVADTNASLHGLVGLLSAVIMRNSTGLGQHIDIAMIDATLATDDQVHYDLEDAHPTGPLPNEIWDAPFGPVLISTDFRVLFPLLVQTLDSLEKLDEAMKTINIAWGEIRNPVDISNQPTIASRNSIVQMDDREGGTRPITQSPYRFSNAESGVRGPAPHRGEHNVEILSDWLGLSPAEISSLQTDDVILFDADWKHH